MEDIMNFVVQNPVVIVIGAAIIFILALIFVIKRIFTFILTLIVLVICIVAGYVMIYPDSALNYFKEHANEDVPPSEDKPVQEQVQETYRTGKEKVMEFIERFKDSPDDEQPED
jgi:flagellar biosynthesis component FlhA